MVGPIQKDLGNIGVKVLQSRVIGHTYPISQMHASGQIVFLDLLTTLRAGYEGQS